MRPTHLRTPYKFDLSPRQEEVIRLMALGRTNAEIAEQLGISLDGAKYHVREILGKLGVESREEAVAAWRESRSSQGRLRRWVFALRGVPGLPLVTAGVATCAAIAVVLVMTGVFGRDNDKAALPGDEPPAATSTVTATPETAPATATPATGSTPGTPGPVVDSGVCPPSLATARLELVPDGQDVLLQMFIDGSGCSILGEGLLSVVDAPVPSSDVRDSYANTERTFKLSLDLPQSQPVASWRWMNQCSPAGPAGWEIKLGGLRARAAAGLRPSCTNPGRPMVLAVEGNLDGETTAGFPCKDRVAGWLCESALRISKQVLGGELLIVVKGGKPTEYTCVAGGQVQGFEYSNLCVGRPAGEVAVGYPLSVHGSHGGPAAMGEILDTLDGALSSGTRPYFAALGCPVDPGTCSTFVVAFATTGQPRVVYLVFELLPGRVPAFVGAGVSGDNAEDILAGQMTMTAAGETQFVSFSAPP